jgi:hypothetical protein
VRSPAQRGFSLNKTHQLILDRPLQAKELMILDFRLTILDLFCPQGKGLEPKNNPKLARLKPVVSAQSSHLQWVSSTDPKVDQEKLTKSREHLCGNLAMLD